MGLHHLRSSSSSRRIWQLPSRQLLQSTRQRTAQPWRRPPLRCCLRRRPALPQRGACPNPWPPELLWEQTAAPAGRREQPAPRAGAAPREAAAHPAAAARRVAPRRAAAARRNRPAPQRRWRPRRAAPAPRCRRPPRLPRTLGCENDRGAHMPPRYATPTLARESECGVPARLLARERLGDATACPSS